MTGPTRRTGRLLRVLRVGLTGGIGAGKSTVAGRLAECGALVIDADRIAREVVEPGTDGLRQIVAAFGPEVLAADGSLDRPTLAGRVFSDDDARATLNGIVHPKIAVRTAELIAAAADDAVIVHDVPLLVEGGMAAAYHLVIVVDAPIEERIRRLTASRGMAEADARARVSAQATEEQRRAVADVWLDNGGSQERILPVVDALWTDRAAPYEENVRLRRPAATPGPSLSDYDDTWPRQAERLAARVSLAAGGAAIRVDHVGSTSVPGLAAKDVIDLQLSVRSIEDADAMVDALADAGFPRYPGQLTDRPHPANPDERPAPKRVHVNADPARRVNLHVRVLGSPAWRYTLLFRDWLRAEQGELSEYRELKRGLAAAHGSVRDYAAGSEPWFDRALLRAEDWAARTDWTPPAG